jgi:hypothetical protein
MLLIYLKHGECIEVRGGVSVRERNGVLFCYGRSHRELASFPADAVELYTFDEQEAQALIDEACDTVTIVGQES